MAYPLNIKRIYLPPAPEDGFRVLVDRLWPRGVSREKAALDLWAKDAAPTTALRTWFRHQPDRFSGFEAAYRAELHRSPEADQFFRLCAKTLETRPVTLLYAAADPVHNHAQVLRAWLEERLAGDNGDTRSAG